MRGVSKRVIEIRDPEDRCFERVVFFLSPGVDQGSMMARMRGEEYLNGAAGSIRPRGRGRGRGRWRFLFLLTAAALLGGGVSALLTGLR